MSNFLCTLVLVLNTVANTLGRALLAPLAFLPGWLSATLIAVVTGVLLLACFKYTSNQNAIKQVRDDIKAHLLSIKLFKENVRVAFSAQGRIILGAGKLLVFALIPMLVMMVPVLLILGQLNLWYQAAPLRVGDETVLKVTLNQETESLLHEVKMNSNPAIDVAIGPFRVPSFELKPGTKSYPEVFWKIVARQPGYHRLAFQVGDQTFEKEVAVGSGFMRVSPKRPERKWTEVLLNPDEPPYQASSTVQSIELSYPRRESWTSGTDSWVIYWFVLSMVAGFCFKGMLKVNM